MASRLRVQLEAGATEYYVSELRVRATDAENKLEELSRRHAALETEFETMREAKEAAQDRAAESERYRREEQRAKEEALDANTKMRAQIERLTDELNRCVTCGRSPLRLCARVGREWGTSSQRRLACGLVVVQRASKDAGGSSSGRARSAQPELPQLGAGQGGERKRRAAR
ncbi:hypothetical protein EON66_03995 [archaeon]|nr:MAG: hypothetical protein EON66_03995 [archaeon]